MEGFQSLSLSQQRVVDSEIFPLCLTKDSSCARTGSLFDMVESQREQMDDLLRRHRAILFRDCGLRDAQDLHNFIEATGLNGMEYVGGAAVRTQLTSKVFTANESPSSEKIPFHHEMAQTPNPPTHLFFFCETAPTEGGETPILVSTEMAARMAEVHPDFMRSIEEHGVQYIRIMPEEDDKTSAIGRGWKSTFLADDRPAAEAALRGLGSTWEWLADGSLKTVTAVVPAVKVDSGPRRSQQKAFYNSIVAAFTGWNDSRNVGERAVVLGDGCHSLLDAAAIADAARLMDEICVSIPWQPGDVMLVDNRTVMHSRRPFSGPRRILAGLIRDADR